MIDATEKDVKECLALCFAKYAPEYDKGRHIYEMLGWGLNYGNRTPEQIMIGALSIAEGKYVDPDELLPVLTKEKK